MPNISAKTCVGNRVCPSPKLLGEYYWCNVRGASMPLLTI